MDSLGHLLPWKIRANMLVKVRSDTTGAHQRRMLIGRNARVAIDAAVIERDGQRARRGIVFHRCDAVGLDRGHRCEPL